MLGIGKNSDDEDHYLAYKTTTDTEAEPMDAIQENQLLRSRIRREEDRINRMNKVDLARMFLGQEDTYTLKEFKKIYKAEIRRNPRLYNTSPQQKYKNDPTKEQKLQREKMVNKVIEQAYDQM